MSSDTNPSSGNKAEGARDHAVRAMDHARDGVHLAGEAVRETAAEMSHAARTAGERVREDLGRTALDLRRQGESLLRDKPCHALGLAALAGALATLLLVGGRR